MKRAFLVGVAVAMLLSTLSCAEMHERAPAEAVEAALLCERMTDAMCRGNIDCCDLPERSSVDHATCVEDNLWLCDLIIGRDTRADAFAYDAARAGELVAAMEQSATSCRALPDLGLDRYLRRVPESARVGLASVLSPTILEGGACGIDAAPAHACHGELVCEREPAVGMGGAGGLGSLGGPGICALREPTTDCAVGLSGSLGRDRCPAGLRCEVSSGEEGSCVPRKPEGDACDRASDCETQYCEGGVCASPPPERSHCPVWRGRIG